jgi:hypothetical protein
VALRAIIAVGLKFLKLEFSHGIMIAELKSVSKVNNNLHCRLVLKNLKGITKYL